MIIKIWLKAIRAPFFTATIIPVTLGSVIAWHDTNDFMWLRFWLTMLGVLFVHTGTNLANDYFDHVSGCDEANSTPTPFSGGSRVIQNGLIAPRKILYVSLVSFIIGSAIGLYLNHLCKGNIILVLGMIGVSLGFFIASSHSV
ncbi:MAG: prenyltransferase [Candidatus Omnitrophica bacterium]|nr:prenyltransferase [Candidatus Omnitrophota bacterium]MBU4590369.1 prenyltransferase [Candidatus Omnitrophota bacterium]